MNPLSEQRYNALRYRAFYILLLRAFPSNFEDWHAVEVVVKDLRVARLIITGRWVGPASVFLDDAAWWLGRLYRTHELTNAPNAVR